jgi:hypothetical protein
MYFVYMIGYFGDLFLAAYEVVIIMDQIQITMKFVWPYYV